MKNLSKYKALLDLKKNTFEMKLVRDSKENAGESGKVVYKNSKIMEFIDDLHKRLEFSNFDVLIAASSEGDPDSYRFSMDLEKDELLDMNEVLAHVKNFESLVENDLSYKVKNELRSNMLSDLSASVIEQLSEKLAYDIFQNMQELLVTDLVIHAENVGRLPQLVNMITKNAALAKINVAFG